MAHYSCTPSGQSTFAQTWHQTGTGPALPTIPVRTAVVCKGSAADAAAAGEDQREWARFNSEHIPGAKLDDVP